MRSIRSAIRSTLLPCHFLLNRLADDGGPDRGSRREERTKALEAENVRLREALAPFAAVAHRMGDRLPDNYELPTTSLTMGDLRRARDLVGSGWVDQGGRHHCRLDLGRGHG